MIEVLRRLEADNFFPGEISADGKIHRFKRDSADKGTSGWYVCHQNHSDKGEIFYVCIWGDWREYGNDQKFITGFTQTKFDKKKIEEQFAKAEKARKEEQARVWEESSKAATERWGSFQTSAPGAHDPGSIYVTRKKLGGLYGAKTQLDPASSGRAIYVPVCDVDGKIWGLQKICEDGQKRFSPGTKKSGNFFVVGGGLDGQDIFYLAEGFATAVSIHLALGRPVVCCFDSGNLEPVAKALRAKYKDARFVVCGDDDRFTESGNTGRDSAESAAKAVLGKSVFPDFKSTETRPTDFNDLHCLEGIEAVKAQISGIRPEISRVFTLGHLGDNYYYITSSNQQITEISTAAHSPMKLLGLMPEEYWESQYPGTKGVEWQKASSELMKACRKAGVFQPEKVRGVGVWPERDGAVVNLGDTIWRNSAVAPLNSFPSKHTYEIGQRIKPPHEDYLKQDECQLLIHAVETLQWKRPEFAKFFAGWIVVAPLAGLLQWRPHIWLNGPSGSGKSWIMQMVVSKMFGSNRYFFQGSTTEAGIRQTVGSDARPVIFDEFETDDENSSDRIRNIIELIRQASSESDGMVVKGGAGGHSLQYRVRFAAMVASVRVNLIHEQDKNRFTLLDLDRSEKGHFPRVQSAFKAITDEYAARLFSRSIRLSETILANQGTFQTVLAEKYNSRFGQQYGTLLAGYGALLSDTALSPARCEEIVAGMDLDEESEVVAERDERDCIEYLLNKVVRVDSVTWGLTDRSIGELLQCAQSNPAEEQTVNRLGFKTDYIGVYVAHSHPELQKLFSGTKWVGGWKKPLSRLAGAEIKQTKRFGVSVHRSVFVPFTTLFPSI